MSIESPFGYPEYLQHAVPFLGGIACWYLFENHDVSIVRHSGSYGNKNGEGLWEMNLLDRNGNPVKHEGFDANGIRGWMTKDDVKIVLKNIT